MIAGNSVPSSLNAQGSPAWVGLTGLRAFTTILPSTAEARGELGWCQTGLLWTGAEAATVGKAPDDNCSANADKQDDSNSDPGNGSRTQAVL